MSDETNNMVYRAPMALEQGSEAWRMARVGSLGASVLHEALAKTKAGFYGATRASRMATLVIERITGVPVEVFVTKSMQQGKDREPIARFEYSLRTDLPIVECGLFRHPGIEWTHASPDGLVGDDGMLEIKCPELAAHMETILWDSVPDKYIMQMQWQMACAGPERKWCDYVSYNPDFPDEARVFVKRVERDDHRIHELEKEVLKFLIAVDEQITAYHRKFPGKESKKWLL